MKISEARDCVLDECRREKRIAIRNSVFIVVIALSVMAILYRYAFPQIVSYVNNVQEEITTNPYQDYYKWALVFGVFLTILYPLIALYKVLKRTQKVIIAFDKISDGKSCRIIGDQTLFLTTIPLFWVKLKLNPIYYLNLVVDSKSYDFPVQERLATEIKLALSGADIEKVTAVMNQLYSDDAVGDILGKDTELKSIEAFKNFSKNEFTNDIENMESGRKTSKNMFVIQLVIAFCFVGTMFYVSMINPEALSNGESILKLVGIVVGASVLLSLVMFFYLKSKNKNSSKFTDFTDFKKSIFTRLVQFINPTFEYIEKGHIGKQQLLHSGLMTDTDYKITGGDQIIGIYNGVPFQSCNLFVTHRPQFRNEKEADNIVFSGNYFVARFNKRFKFPIYIHPKKGFFGDLNDNSLVQYLAGTRHKIKLEDPEFDKQFMVYCDDEIVARYVLTTAMMERIKSINIRSQGNLYIAINENNIVLANNVGNTLMEMNGPTHTLFTKIDQALLNQLYEELIADLGMIDVLKLNVNIWN